MLRKIREAQKNEEGFTLIELLVVVIIIGILAAIAIPTFLNQRESAWMGAAEADARNAALEVESEMTRSATNSYPATNTDFLALDLETSPAVTLRYVLDSTDADHYTIEACHANLSGDGECTSSFEVAATYDNTLGGLQ